MPKADAIFITHEHGDHLDPKVIGQIKTDKTAIYANASSVKKAGFGEDPRGGGHEEGAGRDGGSGAGVQRFAGSAEVPSKDRKDNGYVLTFGGKRVYVAGGHGGDR